MKAEPNNNTTEMTRMECKKCWNNTFKIVINWKKVCNICYSKLITNKRRKWKKKRCEI